MKGLPGTLCELQGCVAWTDDLSVRPVAPHIGRKIKAGYEVKPLTWQDIVEIAYRLVTEAPNDPPAWLENEKSYYEAVLEEFNKTRK